MKRLNVMLTCAALLVTAAAGVSAQEVLPAHPFSLPALPYAADALSPTIGTETMSIHHDRHHKAYVDNLNAKAKDFPDLGRASLEEIQSHVSRYDQAVRNNAGGHYNHSLFWTLLSPEGGQPSPALEKRLVETFGSRQAFEAKFTEAATKVFGSGWTWLIVKPDGSLAITTTANQDNPLMDVVAEKGFPLLALDVWEHAYYLGYLNKRADYIKSWWTIVNWNAVNSRFDSSTK